MEDLNELKPHKEDCGIARRRDGAMLTKKGEWMGTVCSVCGKSVANYYDCDYCPKCGARMD